MMIKDMNYISKVVSKLYAVENGNNVVVAEMVENPGCGFDYLIRIKPQYKNALPIFAKCMELCKIQNINIDYEYLKMSYDREYLFGYENIALVLDDIIE